VTYKILEFCVKCGSCIDVCPVGAISEGENTYIIDPKKCNDCGQCLENNHCPAWAIVKE
jgi:ferredoxin